MNIESISLLLKDLKLTSMIDNLEEIEEKATEEKWSYLKFLSHLLEVETNSRYSARIRKYIKESKLPAGKTLATFKFQEVAGINQKQIMAFAESSKWVRDYHNILIFGPSGLGKTHLACSIAHGIIMQGIKALFMKTTMLVQKLQAAKKELCLPEVLTKLSTYPLLILDDIGYARKNELETAVLFELIADRYEMGSLIITSNLAFKCWDQIFPDNVMAVAAVDRLVHHATCINLTGASYRKKEFAKEKK